MSALPRLAVRKIHRNANELKLGEGQKAWHIPDWERLSHPQRLQFMRQIALQRGRDPRFAQLAIRIIRAAGAQPREYAKQAAALLAWVQNPKNVYYVNEPGEKIQDPVYTVKVGHGDCDDMIILLMALFESIGLTWRYVLSGRDLGANKKLRYIEGEALPPNVKWTHVYGMVGTPPYRPTTWYFCEPTVQGVPLGWDVISGDHSYLPEMGDQHKGPPRLAVALAAPKGFKPIVPHRHRRSPAYDMAYGDALGSAGSIAGGMTTAEMVDDGSLSWKKVGVAVVTGIAVSVATSLALDWFNGKGIWEHKGHVFKRWSKQTRPTVEGTVFRSPSPL